MKQPTAKKTHILIVADDRNTRLSVEYILTAANYKVTPLASASEALEALTAAQNIRPPVDLLIADIQMPSLSGLELLAELNRHHIKIPTLVTTAHRSQDLQFELVRLGYDNILIKPFDEVDLLARTAQMLEPKQGSEELSLG